MILHRGALAAVEVGCSSQLVSLGCDPVLAILLGRYRSDVHASAAIGIRAFWSHFVCSTMVTNRSPTMKRELWHSLSAGGLLLGTLFFAASLTPTLLPRT